MLVYQHMRWHQLSQLPSIEAPEGCGGEAQLIVSRPKNYHLTTGVVLSCAGIGGGTPNVIFEAKTLIQDNEEESAFIEQMKPIGEMSLRQFCKNCPLNPDFSRNGESTQGQLKA